MSNEEIKEWVEALIEDKNSKNEKFTNEALIIAMGNGIIGAEVVLKSLIKQENGFELLMWLHKNTVYGSDIWLAFKDHSGEDINLLARLIRENDQGILRTIQSINETYQRLKPGDGYKREQSRNDNQV